MDLDVADALCERHCPALHAVYAELPAERVHWSLTRHPPPVVLTVLADLLGIVSAWEAPVIALTLSGGYGQGRSADAGQGCSCRGPALEGWQTLMPCDQAPASEGQYESSSTAPHIMKMESAQFRAAQHSAAQQECAQHIQIDM